MTVIERLKVFLESENKRAKYSEGFKDGLEYAISLLEQEQKNNPLVADSHFSKVPTCEKGHCGCETWVRQEVYHARCEQLEEAIRFIENLVRWWGQSDDTGIQRQEIYYPPLDTGPAGVQGSQTVYDFARGIIERAKGKKHGNGDTGNTD
ncbi:MAG TPA: hypothetical protein ENI27_07570 [bacterium]|nr:hypothetical protein [bacterium]